MDRTIFRQGLHSLYLPYYDQLRLALTEDWQPICGLRTFQEQADLYAQGRTKPGPNVSLEYPLGRSVTKADAGLSLHNYGLASDWGYFPGGKYASLAFEAPQWDEFTSTCRSVGLRCISWEKPHCEYPLAFPVSWLLKAYQVGGMATVESLLIKGDLHVGSDS